MKLFDLDTSNVCSMPKIKYNFLDHNENIHYNMSIESYKEKNKKGKEIVKYKFIGSSGEFEPQNFKKYGLYKVYDYIEVCDGFALTCNGNTCFPENVYGIIKNEEYAKHFVYNMNRNSNLYTPDNIKRNDIVEIYGVKSEDSLYNKKAIVTDIKKPIDDEDHGLIEVYILDGHQYFEHFTWTGWHLNFKIIEEY